MLGRVGVENTCGAGGGAGPHLHAVIVSRDELCCEEGDGNLQGAEDAHDGRELDGVDAAVLSEDELIHDAAHSSKGGG